MCHYRGSYEADERAKAEAERQKALREADERAKAEAERQKALREKELQAKRSEVVDRLRREADEAPAADEPARVPEGAAAK